MADHFGDRVEIAWRAFLLRPEPRPRPRDEFVSYSRGWQRMAAMEPRTAFHPWTPDTASEPPASSMPAQVTAKVVAALRPDLAPAAHRALLEAYFRDNRDISDPGVLADVVAEVGVERDGFLTALDDRGDTLSRLVIDEHNAAIAQGITAVPTVVVDDTFPIPGAQETESYIRWLERVLERKER